MQEKNNELSVSEALRIDLSNLSRESSQHLLTLRESNSDTCRALQQRFPKLSENGRTSGSRKSSPHAQSSLARLSSTNRDSSSTELTTSWQNFLVERKQEKLNVNDISLLKLLKSSSFSEEKVEPFFENLVCLSEKIDISKLKGVFDLSDKVSVLILRRLYNHFKVQVNDFTKAKDLRQDGYLFYFDKLIQQDWLIQLARKTAAEMKVGDVDKETLFQYELIWNLCSYPLTSTEACAASSAESSVWSFDKKAYVELILGVNNLIGLEKTLVIIKKLFPQFNSYQQIAANYAVAYLLYYSDDQSYFIDNEVTLCLNLLNQNLKLAKEPFVKSHATEMNKFLQLIYDCQVQYYSSLLFNNFCYLQNLVGQIKFVKKEESFQEVFSLALLAKSKRRRRTHVIILADAMRSFSVDFYQRLHLTEFNQLGKNRYGVNLNREVKYFETMVNFFINELLNLSSDKTSHGAEVLLDILFEACNLSDENNFVDMCCAQILIGVFSNTALDRIINRQSLSEHHKLLLEQAEDLMSPRGGFSNVNNVDEGFKRAIPFMSKFKKNLTYAIDGNSDLFNAASAVGKTLFHVLTIKKMLMDVSVDCPIDLNLFINSYGQISEKTFSKLSTQLKSYSIVFKDGVNNFEGFLDDIFIYVRDELYFHVRFIQEQVIEIDSKSKHEAQRGVTESFYAGNELIYFLFDVFENNTKAIPFAQRRLLINKLEQIVIAINEMNRSQGTMVNPLLLIKKFKRLRQTATTRSVIASSSTNVSTETVNLSGCSSTMYSLDTLSKRERTVTFAEAESSCTNP